jgi:multidrug efflux pump subunit AcrB
MAAQYESFRDPIINFCTIGLAVFGGLASATFITLFFIPVMYSLINHKKQESKNEN